MTSRFDRQRLQIAELKWRLGVAASKLKEWAAECAECGGTGLNQADVTVEGPAGIIRTCEECQDIREAIEDLEAPL